MIVVAAILAAGRGTRFGSDKTTEILGAKPVWRWSLDAFLEHPDVDSVLLICSPDRVEYMATQVGERVRVIAGGATRQASSRAAVEASPNADIILIHDAARPFVTQRIISETVSAIERKGAAGVAVKVIDTIKEVGPNTIRTLNRDELIAMQTPQGARREILDRAHKGAKADVTDEMSLFEGIGVHPEIVEGDPNNFKITTPADLERARAALQYAESRTGIGYDIHPFSDDPARDLFLGGIHFPDHRGLEGHSDADVLLHAACDALLGAAGLGDIGEHFPNTDPEWKGCRSTVFLAKCAELVRVAGWSIVNLDVTVIAETPKIMERAPEIRSVIASGLKIDDSRVSVKATTNERLGAIGRGEGIAAMAIATIRGGQPANEPS
ncbi:MAG: 2-C-methyl-D-erythritol 4-phosphate cytidylyltransferase [Fimbriimonas sp.]|nr:2-C-methyl-D-erythritol 4-phosphate cytidylyltransferase [Fimbriimonas sp.]